MRLLRAHITNFKSLADVTVDFHPHVTAIIGRNNAGKSSVLQALDWLLNVFAGRMSYLSFATEHASLATGSREDVTIVIEAEIQLSEGELRAMFNETLIPLLTSGTVTPFIDLRASRQQGEMGISFHHNGHAKRFILGQETDSFSSGIDEFLDAAGMDAIGGITVDMAPFVRAASEHSLLSFNRFSDRERPAQGVLRLEEDASNLMQFLLMLLSENRPAYEDIVRNVRSIVPEVGDVITPLAVGGQQVFGQIRDTAYPNIPIGWDHVATGTKQIVHLLALASRVSILLIEEPELSLHPDAVVRLMKILGSICVSSDKQLICTTHSPALIEALHLDQIRVAVRTPDGATGVENLSDFNAIEKSLKRDGISLGPFLVRSGQPDSYPRFLLIVEGRDDLKVWEKLLERTGVDLGDVRVVRSDGWQDACKKSEWIGLLKKLGAHSLDYLLLLDSDGDPAKRRKEAQALGLSKDEFVVLNEKELESYLLDAAAIARVTGRREKEVLAAFKVARGSGKERLHSILRNLGIDPDPGIMQAIVQLMKLPDELTAIIERIRASLAESAERKAGVAGGAAQGSSRVNSPN